MSLVSTSAKKEGDYKYITRKFDDGSQLTLVEFPDGTLDEFRPESTQGKCQAQKWFFNVFCKWDTCRKTTPDGVITYSYA